MNKKQIRVIRIKFKKQFGYTCKMSDTWLDYWINFWEGHESEEDILFETIRRYQSFKKYRKYEKAFLSTVVRMRLRTSI